MSRPSPPCAVPPGTLVHPVIKLSLDCGFDVCTLIDGDAVESSESYVAGSLVLGVRRRSGAVELRTISRWTVSEGDALCLAK